MEHHSITDPIHGSAKGICTQELSLPNMALPLAVHLIFVHDPTYLRRSGRLVPRRELAIARYGPPVSPVVMVISCPGGEPSSLEVPSKENSHPGRQQGKITLRIVSLWSYHDSNWS